MAILSKESLKDEMTAYIAAALKVDTSDAEEIQGVRCITDAALEFFSSSVKGAPNGALQILLWTITSALWEGKVSQEKIDQFFSNVDMDPSRMFAAWQTLPAGDHEQMHTVALIPGNLSDADISAVAASLFNSRRKEA